MKPGKIKLIILLTALASFCAFASAEATLSGPMKKLLGYKNFNGNNAFGISAVGINSMLNVSNAFIEGVVGPDGKFNMGAFQPTPWDLLYNWPFGAPWTSFTTVRIDAVNHIYGEEGINVQPPAGDPNVSSWQIDDILITQTLQIVSTSSSTGDPDMLKVQYDVENTGAVAHQVGVRVLMDNEINYDEGAAVPFRLPAPVNDSFDTEAEFLSPNIPPYYQAFLDLYDSIHAAQGTLDGGVATAPDRFVLASWGDIYDTCYMLGDCWDYTITPGLDITTDSAVALYWNPAALAPGAIRTYQTYYGIAGVVANQNPLAVSLGVSGPAQLAPDAADCQRTTNPFTVVAYVQNDTAATITGDSLTLTLPAGLALAAGETAIHNLPDILAGSIVQTSWSVLALGAGAQTYQVTEALNALLAEKTVTVTVPASVCQLVRLYYLSILGREPDLAGWNAWASEIERIIALGIDVKEGFQALALFFFNSAEYQALAKTDTEFVTDLYRTFLQRDPDAAGLAFWVGQLSCVPRSILITQFAYSTEFTALMTSIFGPDTSRPENNLVNDFYRGILNHLPDDAGFNSWLTQMRAAQCTSAQAVRDVSYQIALAFVQSAEYAARNRTNAQYVEDLYNAILRRGAECTGFQTWTAYLTGGELTRQEVLQFFTSSPEFQGRVDAVIAAGCLP